MSDGENVGGSEGAMAARAVLPEANQSRDANATATGRSSEVPSDAAGRVGPGPAQHPPSAKTEPSLTVATRSTPAANSGGEFRVSNSANNLAGSTEVAGVDAQATEPAPPAHIATQLLKDQQRLSDESERAERLKQSGSNAAQADPFGSTHKEHSPGPSTVAPISIVSTPVETASTPSGQQDPRARAFNTKSPNEAVREHPELAATYAAVASIERKVAEDRLSSRQTEIVMQQVRRNVVNSIERGDMPAVQLRQQREVHRDKGDAQDLSR